MAARGSFVRANPAIEAGNDFSFLITSTHEQSEGNGMHIYMFGVDVSGVKIILRVPINPTFDVRVPDGSSEPAIAAMLTTEAETLKIREFNYTVVKLFDPNGFSETPHCYLRVIMSNNWDREKLINRVQELGYKTAGDDTGFNRYFAKYARESKISTAGWNTVSGGYYVVSRGDYWYELALMKTGKVSREKNITPEMKHNKTMVAVWDIETYNYAIGKIPEPGDNYDIFMVCVSFYWQFSDEPLYSMCAVMKPTANLAGTDIIVCKTQKQVIEAFITAMDRMRPDILASYNGGNFDWPLLYDKARDAGLVRELFNALSWIKMPRADNSMLERRYFREKRIKLTAEDTHELKKISEVPGLLDIDLMPVLMGMYPRAEVGKAKSLNYFLEINKLPSKEDMAIKRMFEIYRTGSQEEMAEVAKYCVIDCRRPQQLMIKKLVLVDKREVANLARVRLIDAFFQAGSAKVCNLIGKYSHKFNVAYSTFVVEREREHYPGAWVFPPIRGYNNKRPVTGLDFASLYPSLMRAYNLSPDMIVRDPATARALESRGYSLHHIGPFSYEVAGETKTTEGWTVRHNNVFNRAKSTTRITYDPESGKPREAGEALANERMGIFSFAVDKLFNMRVPIKKMCVKLSEQRENIKKGAENGDLAEIDYNLGYLNAKQGALKLLANTFYGATGYIRSPVYDLLVAGGVTTAGQRNIKFVAEFVMSLGYRIQYGDTDSLYLCGPDELYTEIDAKYAADGDKLAYWSAMVELTMKDMSILCNKVALHLMRDNGTKFLAMAYEEVGFPTVFCGKKKYFLTPHLKQPNFAAEPMLRGIDIVKQGQPEVVKRAGKYLIDKILSIENTREPFDLVVDKFRELLITRFDVDQYAQSKRYRGKKNSVSYFADRMRAKVAGGADPILYEPPENGDKFEYVIVKTEQQYEISGKIKSMTVGDRMEYLRVFKYNQQHGIPSELDTQYYAENCIAGVLARYITYHNRFQPPPEKFDPEAADYYEKVDKYCVDHAKKFLLDISRETFGSHRAEIRSKGAALRKVYNGASKIVAGSGGAALGKFEKLVNELAFPAPPKVGLMRGYYIRHATRMIVNLTRDAAVAEDKARRAIDVYESARKRAIEDQLAGKEFDTISDLDVRVAIYNYAGYKLLLDRVNAAVLEIRGRNTARDDAREMVASMKPLPPMKLK